MRACSRVADFCFQIVSGCCWERVGVVGVGVGVLVFTKSLCTQCPPATSSTTTGGPPPPPAGSGVNCDYDADCGYTGCGGYCDNFADFKCHQLPRSASSPLCSPSANSTGASSTAGVCVVCVGGVIWGVRYFGSLTGHHAGSTSSATDTSSTDASTSSGGSSGLSGNSCNEDLDCEYAGVCAFVS